MMNSNNQGYMSNMNSMLLNMNDVDDKCTIYVGNIAFEAPDQMFIDEAKRTLAPYLPDATFKVKLMKKGLSRYAFMMFQTPETAEYAKHILNGHVILGKPLRVGFKTRCTDSNSPPPPPSSSSSSSSSSYHNYHHHHHHHQSPPPPSSLQQQQQQQQQLPYSSNMNRMYHNNNNNNNTNINNGNTPYYYLQQQQQQQLPSQMMYQMQGHLQPQPQQQIPPPQPISLQSQSSLSQMGIQQPSQPSQITMHSIIENQRQYALQSSSLSSITTPQNTMINTSSMTSQMTSTLPTNSLINNNTNNNTTTTTVLQQPVTATTAKDSEIRRSPSPTVIVQIEEERLKRDASSLTSSTPEMLRETMNADKKEEGDKIDPEMFRKPLKRELYNVPAVVQGYTVEALRAVIANIRSLVEKDPKMVKDLFTANPQLAYAILYGLNLVGDLSSSEMEAMIRSDSAIALSEIVPPPPSSIPPPPKMQ